MLDLTGDNELTALMADWLYAKKMLKEFGDIEKVAKTALINKLNKNQTDGIKCGQYELKATTVNRTEDIPDRVITHEDIGDIIKGKKGRAGYVKITINEVEND